MLILPGQSFLPSHQSPPPQAPAAFLDPASLKYALPEVTSPRHTEVRTVKNRLLHESTIPIHQPTIASRTIPQSCQVAFLGRSNVGKSSLVGALLKDAAGGSGKGLVRTSKTPGQWVQSIGRSVDAGDRVCRAHVVALPLPFPPRATHTIHQAARRRSTSTASSPARTPSSSSTSPATVLPSACYGLWSSPRIATANPLMCGTISPLNPTGSQGARGGAAAVDECRCDVG